MNRKLFFRWVAAGLLWLLIITATIVSVRSAATAARDSRIAAKAITYEQEVNMNMIRDLARSFAVEWATWNGNQDDYTGRLKHFLKSGADSTSLPGSLQEVTAATVESVSAPVNNTYYRVRVLLHVRRLVPVTDNSAPPAYVPVTVDDLSRAISGGGLPKNVQAWRDLLMCVEIPIKFEANGPQICGLPTLVSPAAGSGIIDDGTLSDTPDQAFIVFVNQFMNMYYTGQSLTNYLAPDAKIMPVSGWKLDSVDAVSVNSKYNPTLAKVRVTVSGPGVNKLSQTVFLHVQKSQNSYLVNSLGAGF